MASPGAAAETSRPLTIHAVVLNDVGVPVEMLEKAQQDARRIFAAAGIDVVWLPAQEPPAELLIVKIVATPLGQQGRNPNVLATTPGSKDERRRFTWLFYPRIEDQARLFGLEVWRLLGHVMAHERWDTCCCRNARTLQPDS